MMRPSAMPQLKKQRLLRLVGSVLVLASVVSCTDKSSDKPSVERWSGPLADVRVRWSASPGIDLLSGVAVPVRAYTESYKLADQMGSRDYVYPGFVAAVRPDDRGVGPWPDNREPVKRAVIGNYLYHLLRLEDAPSGETVAIVCHWTYAAAKVLDDGTVQPYTDVSWPILTRIWMTSPGESSAEKLPPQSGSLAAPENDVFGGWKILSRDYGSEALPPGENWPTFVADQNACIANTPDPAERREFLTSGRHARADFPTLPPFPGWPETE